MGRALAPAFPDTDFDDPAPVDPEEKTRGGAEPLVPRRAAVVVLMANSLDNRPHKRKPGPYAGQDRRCAHVDGGVRCITPLHQWHEGRYCHAHENLHVEEVQRDRERLVAA